MAEYSSFFNSFNGDRRYTAAQFAEYFASFIGNGIFWGGDALKVNVLLNMDVQVLTGKAFVNGYYYSNTDASKVLSISESHPTMARIDKVVLQLNLSQPARAVSAVVKTGEPASAPEAPSLQRDNAMFELALADIFVGAGVTAIMQSNITDLRLSAELCGVVAGLIKQPDLTNIFDQYAAKYQEVSVHWDEWSSDAKNEFRGWFAQAKAELFATMDTDFDDFSRFPGYDRRTAFLAGGSVNEVLVNRFNGTELASRVTEFRADKSIVETLTFNEPMLTATKTTVFNADGSVTESVDGTYLGGSL